MYLDRKRIIVCSSSSTKTVYKASNQPISTEFNDYTEIGMHCGTLEQAKSILRGHEDFKIYEIVINPKKMYCYDDDIVTVWSGMNVIHEVIRPTVSSEEYRDLILKFRQFESDTDKNKFVRDWFTSKGYDCIQYINKVEGSKNDISYIVLDNKIILSSSEYIDKDSKDSKTYDKK